MKVEIERNPNDSRYAISRLNAYADSSGRGLIDFKTYAGNGWTTSVSCTPGLTPTRVTQMSGVVEIYAGVKKVTGVQFNVKRS